MKNPLLFRQAALLCALFVAVDLLTQAFLPVPSNGQARAFAWAVAANALVALTMALVASRARWRGLRLALALAAIPWAIGVVNVVEGLIYLKSELGQPGWILAFLTLKYAIVLPLWPRIFRELPDRPSVAPADRAFGLGGKLWRFVLCDFLYLILYFIAGILIFPLVRDFYTARSLPPVGQIFGLQLLLRGPVFIAVGVLLLQMIPGRRLTRALAVGLAFTLISGVAPLIVPTPLLPDAIRWIHLGEVTWSNFVFGTLVAFIWSRKSPRSQPAS